MRSSVPPTSPCSFIQSFGLDIGSQAMLIWMWRYARVYATYCTYHSTLSLSLSEQPLFSFIFIVVVVVFFLSFGEVHYYTERDTCLLRTKKKRINKWKLSNWNLHRNSVDGCGTLRGRFVQKQYLRIFLVLNKLSWRWKTTKKKDKKLPRILNLATA